MVYPPQRKMKRIYFIYCHNPTLLQLEVRVTLSLVCTMFWHLKPTQSPNNWLISVIRKNLFLSFGTGASIVPKVGWLDGRSVENFLHLKKIKVLWLFLIEYQHLINWPICQVQELFSMMAKTSSLSYEFDIIWVLWQVPYGFSL